MPTIRSTFNQFHGINPHLHSVFQSQQSWNNFHNPHIVGLMQTLLARLLPMGYVVSLEDSIQVRRIDDYHQRYKSDWTIFDLDPIRAAWQPSGTSVLTGTVVPLPVVLEDNPISEKPYQAVVVYNRRDDAVPVAWFELLSPSNKRHGEDANTYIRKRNDLLGSGIVFVELDYLHETPATITLLSNYALHKPGSHPYRILVFNPRPEIETGLVSINEFDVDQPIPTVAIPLSGDDVLYFDFDVPYQQQFQQTLYGLTSVDYAELPVHFERYAPVDQVRIAARLLAILRHLNEGQTLSAARLPTRTLNPDQLPEALAEIV